MTAHDDMTIGEVATLAGLRASALRYYEKEGLVAPVRRVNGRRRYDRAVLDRLKVIAMAQSVGFTISEVKTLMAGFDASRVSRSWKSLANAKLGELESQMKKMRLMMKMLENALACGCVDAVACIKSARQSG